MVLVVGLISNPMGSEKSTSLHSFKKSLRLTSTFRSFSGSLIKLSSAILSKSGIILYSISFSAVGLHKLRYRITGDLHFLMPCFGLMDCGSSNPCPGVSILRYMRVFTRTNYFDFWWILWKTGLIWKKLKSEKLVIVHRSVIKANNAQNNPKQSLHIWVHKLGQKPVGPLQNFTYWTWGPSDLLGQNSVLISQIRTFSGPILELFRTFSHYLWGKKPSKAVMFVLILVYNVKN